MFACTGMLRCSMHHHADIPIHVNWNTKRLHGQTATPNLAAVWVQLSQNVQCLHLGTHTNMDVKQGAEALLCSN